jgi:hypothetical protein
VIHTEPATTEYRVCLGKRDAGNTLVSLQTLARPPIVHVGALSPGIGPHHAKVWAGPKILVGHPGGDDQHIPMKSNPGLLDQFPIAHTQNREDAI